MSHPSYCVAEMSLSYSVMQKCPCPIGLPKCPCLTVLPCMQKCQHVCRRVPVPLSYTSSTVHRRRNRGALFVQNISCTLQELSFIIVDGIIGTVAPLSSSHTLTLPLKSYLTFTELPTPACSVVMHAEVVPVRPTLVVQCWPCVQLHNSVACLYVVI